MEKLKALLHIDELSKWRLTLANAKNLIEDAGEESLMLEIVVNSEAVQLFDSRKKDVDRDMDSLFKQMEKLVNQGVKVIACRNALRANAIQEEILPSFVVVVPAGITTIVTKQMEGYSYVKP